MVSMLLSLLYCNYFNFLLRVTLCLPERVFVLVETPYANMSSGHMWAQISLCTRAAFYSGPLISTTEPFHVKKISQNNKYSGPTSGPEVIKFFSYSTQLRMKFVLLINLKLQTIANSFLLNIAEHENFSANKYELLAFSYLLAEKFSCSVELSIKNVL